MSKNFDAFLVYGWELSNLTIDPIDKYENDIDFQSRIDSITDDIDNVLWRISPYTDDYIFGLVLLKDGHQMEQKEFLTSVEILPIFNQSLSEIYIRLTGEKPSDEPTIICFSRDLT